MLTQQICCDIIMVNKYVYTTPPGIRQKGNGKMSKYVHKSPYFYGNKISDYGLENGYVDYATLSKAFDAVLVNDITKLFFADINGEFNEPEQVNGFIDNSERLEEIEEELETLHNETVIENNETDTPEYEFYMNRIEELEEEKEELEREQDNNPEIFQYFIISDNGAEILQELTDEIVYYLPVIDCYVWGVTHYGTAWDYVLTDIPVEIEQ